MEPFRLRPLLVEKPWGGRRLADLGRTLPPDVPIGESWDVADLDPALTTQPDPVSRVVDGLHAGLTLHEVIAAAGDELLGETPATSTGRFPLLVKHLDAREHLSVQVHPPAPLVDTNPGWVLKTESWVVVHAEPAAYLMLGLADDVTFDALVAAAGTPEIVRLLRRVPARVGDVHHLPAGMIHALGAGVVVAEVQTPSDTTFRMYDWTEEYGRAPRELHLDAALSAIRAAWQVNVMPHRPRVGRGEVVSSAHYRIMRQGAVAGDGPWVTPRTSPRIVIGLEGQLRIPTLPLTGPGGVVVLPAVWAGPLLAEEDSTWLEVDL